MEHSLNVTGNTVRKHVYPLKMEILPLNDSIHGPKDNNVVQSTVQDLPKESEIDISPNRIITTITQKDLQTKTSKKREHGDSEYNNDSNTEENDESFRFKRHKNRSGVPTLGERLDLLQQNIPPKRMENFDSSFPVQPSSQNNNHNRNNNDNRDNNHGRVYNKLSKNENFGLDSIQSPTSPSLGRSNNQSKLNVPTLLPLNQNLEYSNQMYPMYYVPMPTSPINPQYYTSDYNANSNNKPNDPNRNIRSIPAIPNAFFQYPPSSQPVVQPFPQFVPIPTNINGLGKQPTSNKYTLSNNRSRRLSIVSNRENSMIMPHSDISTKEYYRHLTNTNVSNKLKQLFTWCAIKTYQDFKERNSTFLNKQSYYGITDPTRTVSTYLDTKRMTLSIINDFINDLQHGLLDIDWSPPSNSKNTTNKQGKETIVRLNNSNGDNIDLDLNEDPILEELFDDEDNISEISKNDPDNVTYYYDGLNMKKFKKNKGKQLDNESSKIKKGSNMQPENKLLQKLLPNPKNAENEKNLELLNTRIGKLKDEIDEWKKVIDEKHPDSEWNSVIKLSGQKHGTSSIKENMDPELISNIEKLDKSASNIGLELSERVDKLQAHSHLYKSYSQLLTQSLAHRIDFFVTEFKHNQKKKTIKSKNVKDFLLELSRAKTKNNNDNNDKI